MSNCWIVIPEGMVGTGRFELEALRRRLSCLPKVEGSRPLAPQLSRLAAPGAILSEVEGPLCGRTGRPKQTIFELFCESRDFRYPAHTPKHSNRSPIRAFPSRGGAGGPALAPPAAAS